MTDGEVAPEKAPPVRRDTFPNGYLAIRIHDTPKDGTAPRPTALRVQGLRAEANALEDDP